MCCMVLLTFRRSRAHNPSRLYVSSWAGRWTAARPAMCLQQRSWMHSPGWRFTGCTKEPGANPTPVILMKPACRFEAWHRTCWHVASHSWLALPCWRPRTWNECMSGAAKVVRPSSTARGDWYIRRRRKQQNDYLPEVWTQKHGRIRLLRKMWDAAGIHRRVLDPEV